MSHFRLIEAPGAKGGTHILSYAVRVITEHRAFPAKPLLCESINSRGGEYSSAQYAAVVVVQLWKMKRQMWRHQFTSIVFFLNLKK